LHDQTLIHACPGTRGLEELFAKTAVCARYHLDADMSAERPTDTMASVTPNFSSNSTVASANLGRV
jgi:hypothetical protein